MKNTRNIALALTLLAGTGTAFAQPYDNHDRAPMTQQHRDNVPPVMQHRDNAPPVMQHQDDRDDHRGMPAMNMRAHNDWRAGGHITRNDWRRGVVINYRDHHLRRPPRGYEWREVDGNFVLAAVTTGLIASIILASH